MRNSERAGGLEVQGLWELPQPQSVEPFQPIAVATASLWL